MSTIDYFRIYKIDKKLYNFNDDELLPIINVSVLEELKEDNLSKLKLKKISDDISYYIFSGVLVDKNAELPKWYNFLKIFNENEKYYKLEEKYSKIKKSILSVFKIKDNFYIITFGNGFHSRPKQIIEEDFGIELCKKMITINGEIKSLYQSVISGDLDNTYKSLKRNNKYNPMADISNLGKLTKGLNGYVNTKEIFYDIKELQGINISLEGNEGIKFQTGEIDRKILLNLLLKIEEVYNSNPPNSLKIPDLKKIDSKTKEYLEILKEISQNINTSYFNNSLFINYIFGNSNNIVGRIISFDIIENKKRFSYNENDYGIFENIDFIKILIGENFTFENLSQIKFTKIKIEIDGNIEQINLIPNLLNCISGEIEINNKLYLYEGAQIYLPNKDFTKIVKENYEREIDKLTINDKNFLLNWDLIKEPYEKDFNKKHDIFLDKINGKNNIYCLDKGVDKRYGFGKGNEIELCDLIKEDKGKFYFIHVKKTGGADIRVLFSQGRVGTDILIDKTNDVLNHIEKKTRLKLLTKKIIDNREFFIVYAIKRKTKNTFTLYAKYDLLNTLESFHNKGLGNNVKLYFIN